MTLGCHFPSVCCYSYAAVISRIDPRSEGDLLFTYKSSIAVRLINTVMTGWTGRRGFMEGKMGRGGGGEREKGENELRDEIM